TDQEGGMAKYFSQRFAQVTNPPLDSLRESDGMTLRVALGAKPFFNRDETMQLVIDNPILAEAELARIKAQTKVPLHNVDMTFVPDMIANDDEAAVEMTAAIEAMCDAVQAAAEGPGGIVILSDAGVSSERAALPLVLSVSAANQRLIQYGLRFRVSLVAESGQIASSHHIATTLGFGAAAVAPIAAYERATELFGSHGPEAVGRFIKAGSKALMKTMGKVGLCTVESYSGGEFFEPNYLNTNQKTLGRYFPNVKTPVGGVGLETISGSVRDWHRRATEVKDESGIPLLGLFKERADGAGHSYGVQAVRSFEDMTEEPIAYQAEAMGEGEQADLRLMTLDKLKDSVGLDETAYKRTGFDKRDATEIDSFCQTQAYRNFANDMAAEREARPAALRDVLDFPTDFTEATTQAEFLTQLNRHDLDGNSSFAARGLTVSHLGDNRFALTLDDGAERLAALSAALKVRFNQDVSFGSQAEVLEVTAKGDALSYLKRVVRAPSSLAVSEVEAPSSITKAFASGAMSHGALVAPAHEAVAHGTNIVGAMSNSGEGGEHFSRYGTIRSSKIKQIASGRFGVWAGYLADPAVEELEIKIAQGAKPGEGGQLPAQKVTVEIAAARGGTPGVELVSPPPHHDTYSIEDLAQLIHDCKAARVRVIVKLVSSEGIGTIAVGVAKAGADVINVAGNTGGTGAAQVTSLKYTGRSAEIGLAEVHQALCANGIRKKVILRCSGAHQTATDVVKSCLLGGDSFEFGTTALMMLKCVMAKNCNVKCPAGLTTNPEVFEGDPRALAQYFMNVAHDVQALLAKLGLPTLRAARGRSDLLQLLNHPSMIGQMDVSALLWHEPEVVIENPVYVPRDFAVDDYLLPRIKAALIDEGEAAIEIGDNRELNNCNKTVFGQLAIDLERLLQYEITDEQAAKLPAVRTDKRNRRFFDEGAVRITTSKSAGQSYGAFLNDGMHIIHSGTCNDGVGKSMSGGTIVVKSPGGGSPEAGCNVLIGNFGLFGATGGRLFVEGEAGDRFAVRNSGTVAVLEGLGDFGCEYMTNGAVLNLGAFGKGFGNGMSGGYAYQYDPEGKLADSYSADSVFLCNAGDETDEAAIHRDAIFQMLTEHVAETGSPRGQAILDNFDAEISHFRYLKPQSFAVYQDADAILAKASRKALVEELAKALASHQVRKFKLVYRDGLTVLDGAVPTPADTDSDKMFALLNSYTVLAMAQRLAADRLKTESRTPEAQAAARKLLLTEDFALMMALTKYAREALATYTDAELATLIANKRLGDYKEALSLRNTVSVHAGGTYGWIILQDRLNRER
ncbi:MAG: glutamate synthase-related protein, partial [Pseudomonadota bacterium]